MWKVFLAALALIALGVFGMCFNIIFRKDGKFPEYEVSQNEDMRRLGIRCMHEQDAAIFAEKGEIKHDHCTGEFSEACKGCALYKEEKI